MRLSEILKRLEAEEIVPCTTGDAEVQNVCASDMLSDLLSTKKSDFVILTGLTTVQIVRTAEVCGALGIVIVRGKTVPPETANLARSLELPLARSRFPLFESCVLLADIKR
jgi:hypothetical protein